MRIDSVVQFEFQILHFLEITGEKLIDCAKINQIGQIEVQKMPFSQECGLAHNKGTVLVFS